MISLFVFILISLLTISGVLFFNKGEKAQEIKSVLKKIYENLKDLFSNFKKLFLILKSLIQSPTAKNEIEEAAINENTSESSSSTESEIISNNDLDTSSDESRPESSGAETQLADQSEIISNNDLDTFSDEYDFNAKKNEEEDKND